MRKLEELETEIIRLAIGRYEGRMSEVARRLGIGRSTLYRKLKELGLEEGEDESPEELRKAAG
jgi:DNA-binding NtrC family response regulator